MKAFYWWFLSSVQSLKKLPNMPSNMPALFWRKENPSQWLFVDFLNEKL
jgi:hypothetical protein